MATYKQHNNQQRIYSLLNSCIRLQFHVRTDGVRCLSIDLFFFTEKLIPAAYSDSFSGCCCRCGRLWQRVKSHRNIKRMRLVCVGVAPSISSRAFGVMNNNKHISIVAMLHMQYNWSVARHVFSVARTADSQHTQLAVDSLSKRKKFRVSAVTLVASVWLNAFWPRGCNIKKIGSPAITTRQQ